MSRVAVVTDSTASLPVGLVETAEIVVVPLEVIVDGVPHREGVDISPPQLIKALRSGSLEDCCGS
jgi:fatty acid-binding protein DegV